MSSELRNIAAVETMEKNSFQFWGSDPTWSDMLRLGTHNMKKTDYINRSKSSLSDSPAVTVRIQFTSQAFISLNLKLFLFFSAFTCFIFQRCDWDMSYVSSHTAQWCFLLRILQEARLYEEVNVL